MTRLAEHLVDTVANGTTAAIAQLGVEMAAEETAEVAASPLAPVLAPAVAEVADAGTSGRRQRLPASSRA
jgi:hypothetical protein